MKAFDPKTADFLAAVFKNMPHVPGNVMKEWVDDPEALQNALRTALCPRKALTAPRVFETWKVIKVGTYKSVEGLKRDLQRNFTINNGADSLLEKITLTPAEMEINLVLASVADLGFIYSTWHGAVYDRARELGLGLVPADAGPQLRLQYLDQPYGESLTMAMETVPLYDSPNSSRGVFRVTHPKMGPRLSSYTCEFRMFSPQGLRVFARL